MTTGLHIWGRMSSINVRKVVLCAQWLGLDFERTDAGRQFGIVKTPAYLALNPNAMIPTMEDGDFVLWESNPIVRYLCAKHAQGTLYPTDLQQRFDAERWMDWQQTALNKASGAAFLQWIRTPPEQRNMVQINDSVAATEPLLAMLDTHLHTRPFMAGDAVTMADFPIACEIDRWWGLPGANPAKTASSYPNIQRWYAHISANPASSSVLNLPQT